MISSFSFELFQVNRPGIESNGLTNHVLLKSNASFEFLIDQVKRRKDCKDSSEKTTESEMGNSPRLDTLTVDTPLDSDPSL